MNTKKRVIFAVPGSKVYISRYYNNKKNSFLNISITGRRCSLMCRHCKATLLEDMLDINSYENEVKDSTERNRLIKIIDRFGCETINGVLISGGFNSEGILPIDERTLEEIKEVKDLYGRKIKIFVHLGFTDPGTAKKLNDCNVDGVLVNVFSNNYSIEKIYNLKNHTPEMFYNNVRLLKEAGLKVSPHIIIGLGENGISDEYRSVKEISQMGVSSVVFVIKKELRNDCDDQEFSKLNINTREIINLYDYTKKLITDIPLILGCAKPQGPEYEKLELELLKRGINIIAFPSDKTIDFAKDQGFKFDFIEQCCAFLV